jgi:hypothetical protein
MLNVCIDVDLALIEEEQAIQALQQIMEEL